MGSTYLNVNGLNGSQIAKIVYTPTSLGRWSVANTQLPAVDRISAIHIYDFDNTLFITPLPNQKLWNTTAIGHLTSPDMFVSGGWWHNSRFLSAVGDGIEKEEPRAWDGWWNERVVKLVKLSMKQDDALTVLLTGRSETGFADLLRRMVKSKGLEFDMMGLKPTVGPNNERFSSTMNFKQAFMTAIMETYKHATEVVIYEDRSKHVKQFQNFLDLYRSKLLGTGRLLRAEVFHVQEVTKNLDPVVEVAEVQQLINHHNEQISKPSAPLRNPLRLEKTVFLTAYMINPTDSQKLVELLNIPSLPESEVKVLASSIPICSRPCPQSVLDKAGGIGAKMTWEVVAIACDEGNVWAARLRPVPSNVPYHTENPTPLVVLALRKGARSYDVGKIQNWKPLPVEKIFQFETTVNEKIVLRIESGGSDDTGLTIPTKPRRDNKRKHQPDEEYPRHHGPPFGGKNDRGQGARGGRGGRGGGNQASRGHKNPSRGNASRGGRGRGVHGYRSLDDVEPKGTHTNTGSYAFPAAVYDDEPPQPQRLMGNMQSQQPTSQPANFNTPQFPQQHQQYAGEVGWQAQPPTGPQGQGRGSMNGNDLSGAGNADSVGNYY